MYQLIRDMLYFYNTAFNLNLERIDGRTQTTLRIMQESGDKKDICVLSAKIF
jgi:hypothetical protein